MLLVGLGVLGPLGPLGSGLTGRPGHTAAAAASADLPPGQLKFRVFGGLDGLRNLVVLSIAQDGVGFLWLGTDDGVYRFDGERFTHFSVDDGLVSSAINVVGVAPDGEVCVGSRAGLACWDGSRFSQAKTRGVPAVPVQRLVSYGGKLWVGTEGSGLYVQDSSGGFVPAPGWPAQATTLRALWADASGVVAGADTTVVLSSGDGVWHDIGDVGLEHERIDGVLRDRQGALWIRTQSHVWLLPRGASRAIDLRDGLPTGYDSAAATAMVIGPRGDVLVGTDEGLAYRDRDRWRVLNRSSGMPAATIRTLFTDREGSLWIGSAGLYQLRGRGLVEYYNAANGLPGDTVWAYRRDREGTLWIGTNRCLARAVAGRWECMPGSEGRLVRTMLFPPQGGVFIGGAPADLLYIDAAGHSVSLGDFGQPPGHNILALALGPEGDLWIATRTGLFRLPGAVPGPLERIEVPGVWPDGRFVALTVADGRLWTASTRGGVVVLDHGEWRVFGTAAGFRNSAMTFVMQRADGRLCASYTEALGLSCFRYDGHGVVDLEHIGTAQGLTSGMIYLLGEDPQHRLWVGTGGGVDILTPQGVDHFDESDGLAGNDTAAMAFLVDPDGSVWLGSTGGATHVFAQHYAGPPPPPSTVVLDGRLDGQPIRDAGNGTTGPEVPHDRNALRLEFAASSMLDAKRIEYEMRMSPLETAWSATHQRQAHYPGLLPGAYSFEVRARIGAGPWGEPTALRFTILPAWWQAMWFIALVAIAGLATIGLLFTWRQRALLRRRTRQLNEQSEASFRAVIDQMPDLMSVYRERVLIYCNTAACRFLGIDQATARWSEITPSEWIHPDDRDQVAELFARVRNLASQPSFEVIEPRVRSADGSWRICEISAVRVEIGNASTVVGSARDVTERKRMRAKLLVSDRMASLGTLAAGIAHEINNPLAYVTGNLEAMAEVLDTSAQPSAPVDRAQLATAIHDARDGAERVRKIVQGLRTFSRSEEERRVPLALPGVIDAAIRLTSNEVRHRAQLVQELGATPLVVADDGRLTQVFINLLVNAAHAIPEGRSDANRITVRTRTDAQGRAVIEVEDTGKGISPELQARVFDPFFTTKDVGEGTGLGLSICHGIVSGLGGQISIESPSAGGARAGGGAGPAGGPGTVVRVVLPPAVQPVAAVAAPDSPAVQAINGHRRHRVMLVDDEPMVVHTMERLLRRDYDVTVALCGQEAIDHIAGGARFDAIVSDVMMPNMTGIELIEQLRRVAPEQAQRLIFLSGGAFTAETRERLAELGAPQLEKPVTAKELRACVLRVTSGSDVVSR
jgi:PAS domain S-box-containing protein